MHSRLLQPNLWIGQMVRWFPMAGNHAGYLARDNDKMVLYFHQLPEELRKAME